jgi:uncharacterized membrane protein
MHRGTNNRTEVVLGLALLLAVANTAYLSWRFVALRSGIVAPGTGICSLTSYVDCDQVLLRPEARAFYIPNALLGFGFFVGCILWLHLGIRLGPQYRHHVLQALAFWLGVSCGATLWFFWLLVHLPNFCPLCPWNHILNYIAFGAAVRLAVKEPRARERPRAKKLGLLVVGCVSLFLIIQVCWAMAFFKGYIR